MFAAVGAFGAVVVNPGVLVGQTWLTQRAETHRTAADRDEARRGQLHEDRLKAHADVLTLGDTVINLLVYGTDTHEPDEPECRAEIDATYRRLMNGVTPVAIRSAPEVAQAAGEYVKMCGWSIAIDRHPRFKPEGELLEIDQVEERRELARLIYIELLQAELGIGAG